MWITRTIWPVGHGAFYTECLGFHHPNSLVSIVYDCGAKTEAIIQNNIDVFLQRLRKINNGKHIVDYLAISHFHKDHVNGLQYILSEADVKHLILPQFSEEALAEAFVYNALHTEDTEDTTKCDIDSPVQQFIMASASQGAYSFDTQARIIQVYPRGEQPLDTNHQEAGSEEEQSSTLESGSRIEVSNLSISNTTSNTNSAQRWILVPINIEYPKTKIRRKPSKPSILEPTDLEYPKTIFQAFLDDLNQLAEGHQYYPISTEEYKVKWDNLKELLKNVSLSKVRKCYEEHYGTNNSYCMPMYSGWENPSFVLNEKHFFENYSTLWHRGFRPWICCECRNWGRFLEDYTCLERPFWQDYRLFQCLYMGDFETKNEIKYKELFNQLGPLWTEIGLQQIPHHVSENNHNSNLYKGLHKICFGNIDDAKDRSCSHHVLKSIYSNGCLPLLVTEEDCCLVFTSKLDY